MAEKDYKDFIYECKDKEAILKKWQFIDSLDLMPLIIENIFLRDLVDAVDNNFSLRAPDNEPLNWISWDEFADFIRNKYNISYEPEEYTEQRRPLFEGEKYCSDSTEITAQDALKCVRTLKTDNGIRHVDYLKLLDKIEKYIESINK